MRARIAWLSLALLGGCFKVNIDNGKLSCSVPDNKCPSGYQCVGGKCWLPGTAPNDMTSEAPSDMALGDDLALIVFPPAAVWTCGVGGALVGSAGAQLNVSAGGTVGVGAASGSNGATITLGYLSSDTY